MVLVATAVFGLADALANATARGAVGLSRTIAPWNAGVAGRYADQEFSRTARPDANSVAAIVARETLRRDALNTDALNVLGLQAQLRNDTQASRRIFAYALAISRRELAARLWAIEEAGARGDIVGALANYDIALRTSSQAGPLLYPQLANALVEPLVRQALLPVLARGPAWSSDFFAVAARNGRSGAATLAAVTFFAKARSRGLEIARADDDALVDSLVFAGRYEAAWNHYAQINKGADRSTNRDPGFRARLTNPTSFDWTALEYGSVQADRDGGLLRYDLPATLGGVVARQYLVLPPGSYRMTGWFEPVAGSSPTRAGTAPYWRLTCEDGSEAGRVDLPAEAGGAREFSGLAKVSSACRFQMLTLVVRPSEVIGGTAGIVRRMVLESTGEDAIRSR